MPFKSEKQKKFMFANKPDIAKKWTEKYGSKPEDEKKKKNKKQALRMIIMIGRKK